MLQCAQCQFLGRAHTKMTKKESVIMGHLWFHTFHLPLSMTVINILHTQNTRLQWFTWANYTYCTSVSIPAGHTVPVTVSLSHLSSQYPTHPPTILQKYFSSSIQLGQKLVLIQSPCPILSNPPFPHSDIPAIRRTAHPVSRPSSPRVWVCLTAELLLPFSGEWMEKANGKECSGKRNKKELRKMPKTKSQ